MKICVTGASGFIGKKLVSRLLAEGHEVCALSRRQSLQGVKTVQGDLLDPSIELQSFFEGAQAIFHCAGELKNKSIMHSLHVDGTKKLLTELEKSLKTTPRPFRWIQLSSVGAYGPPPVANEAREINESSIENPVGDYEVSKTLSDTEVKNKALKSNLFSYTLIRPTIVFGSDMPNQSLFSLVKMIRKGMFFYIGGKNTIANYVHVEDVVDAMLACLGNSLATNETFIVSNDCALEEIVTQVSQSSESSRKFVTVPEGALRLLVTVLGKWLPLPITQERINALVGRTHYSHSHLSEKLGFKPQRDPGEHIAKL